MEFNFQDFAEKGGLAFWAAFTIISILAILVSHFILIRKKSTKEATAFLNSKHKNTGLLQINLICIVTFFLFDWLYPVLFTWFGKKKFIYPSLLSLLGALAAIAKSSGDLSGDMGEFYVFGILPGYFVIHCLGWLHVNLVYYRIKRVLNVSRV